MDDDDDCQCEYCRGLEDDEEWEAEFCESFREFFEEDWDDREEMGF